MITIRFSIGSPILETSVICDEIARMYKIKDRQYIPDDQMLSIILYNDRAYSQCRSIVDQAIAKAMLQ